jgi:hypothetical protein
MDRESDGRRDSTWESTRKPIAALAKDDEVTALTGVSVVLQLGEGGVSQS